MIDSMVTVGAYLACAYQLCGISIHVNTLNPMNVDVQQHMGIARLMAWVMFRMHCAMQMLVHACT
jgi:hypothetical protein